MSKLKFKPMARFDDRFISNAGDFVRTVYGPVFDKDGRMSLEVKGKENLYDIIQSHRDSCNIHVLLKRFANGETDVFSRVQGVFGDFTNLPSTYADLLNKINDGKAVFDRLPVEVRARFNHSFEEFLVASGQPDFANRLGVVSDPAPAAPVVESEVSVSE